MSSITSGVGVFSGINSSALIDQLLAVDARPKTLAQTRIRQLQTQQTAYLDLNSRLAGLKTAAAKFNASNIFQSAAATSSNNDVLSATASNGAVPGSYQFVVDRLVSTQQLLSRGFSDSDSTGLGLTSLSFEPTQARLDRDTPLSQLNGGSGIARGRLVITDSSNANATIDLSRAETVSDVLNAINGATGIHVQARVDGDRLIVQDAATGGTSRLTIADAQGYSTATSLGIAGTASAVGAAGSISGSNIATVGSRTSLGQLNDGLGLSISRTGGLVNPDFRIQTRSGQTFDIDLGDMYASQVPVGGGAAQVVKTKSAVTDLQGVIDRINEQARVTVGGPAAVNARFNAARTGIELVDLTTPSGPGAAFTVSDLTNQTTASELRITGTTTSGTITGGRLIAGLNSTLVRNLNGGAGLGGTELALSTRDGSAFHFFLNTSGSVSEMFRQISDETGGAVTASLDRNGTGFVLTDTTSGSSAFSATGSAATALGLAVSSSSTIGSSNLQHQYVGKATLLSSLNNGRGVGSGTFDIVNSYGVRRTISIGADNLTVGDAIAQINSQGQDIRARVNDHGDGIVIEEAARSGGPGGQAIAITDRTGSVARDLNLLGAASGTGASNHVDGSAERTVTFLATDTLQQVTEKINAANVAASAAIVNDGGASRPYRLSLTARGSGLAGEFVLSTGSYDLGEATISRAQNSRVFFGSADPAAALLFSTSSNTVPGIATGVALTLKAASQTPVTVTVTSDSSAIEKAVSDFVDAFNTVSDKISTLSSYDADTQKRGALLGDGATQSLREALFATVLGPPTGVAGRFQSLSQVGVTVGRDGSLEFNADRLRSAMSLDSRAVADLFAAKTQTAVSTSQPVIGANGVAIPGVTVNTVSTGTFTAQGVAERLVSQIDAFIGPISGRLTRANKAIDEQIKSQNDRITSIDSRIESRRAVLQRQFLAMEQAIGKLQSQQNPINNIRSITG